MATSSITAHIVMSNAKGANALVYALAREHDPRFERHDPKISVITGEEADDCLRKMFGVKVRRARKSAAR